jgi:hypothetical protein
VSLTVSFECGPETARQLWQVLAALVGLVAAWCGSRLLAKLERDPNPEPTEDDK